MLTETERDDAMTAMRNGDNVLIVTPSLEQRDVLDQLAQQVAPSERVVRSNGREAILGAGTLRVCSTRSIRGGAGRGMTLAAVMLIDEAACVDQVVLDVVMPALIVSGGRVICRAHGTRWSACS